MKAIVVSVSLVLATARVQAQAVPRTCDDFCTSVLKGAVSWILETRALAAQDLVVDAGGSSPVMSRPFNMIPVPARAVADLAREMGFEHKTKEEAITCTNRIGECRLVKGKAFATFLGVESIAHDSSVITVAVSANYGNAAHWAREITQLTLRRTGNTWKVVKAKLVGAI